MTNAFKVGAFFGFAAYDLGAIIPWVISTNQMPVYIQLVLIIVHFLFYFYCGKFVVKEIKKQFFNK